MTKDEAYRLHQEWIAVCQLSDKLTEWEENFVNSIYEQLNRKGSLSPRQAEILERIYAKTE